MALPALAFKGSDGILNHAVDVKIRDIQTVAFGVKGIQSQKTAGELIEALCLHKNCI